jgi:hypothetical protein
VREKDQAPLVQQAHKYLVQKDDVMINRSSWEKLYFALPEDDDSLTTLREYFDNKSAFLRPAFKLTD